METVALLQPDLIIINQYLEPEVTEKLTAIAPTTQFDDTTASCTRRRLAFMGMVTPNMSMLLVHEVHFTFIPRSSHVHPTLACYLSITFSLKIDGLHYLHVRLYKLRAER